MSRNLAKLLAKPEKEITRMIRKMEELCGYPSEDVRILAENKQKTRAKIIQLGLDPEDTTDDELYFALRTKYLNDAALLDKAVGAASNTTYNERLAKAVQLVEHCSSFTQMWVIKSPALKSIIKANPPKQVAKHLHYRSIPSMIKREDVGEIYMAAKTLEGSTWQKNATKQISKLTSADYELRPIKIVQLQQQRWSDISLKDKYEISDYQSGLLAIWPSKELKDVSVLSLALLILDGLQKMSPEGHIEALQELSPALGWWADNKYLLSDSKQPISFNIKDVAFNHLKKYHSKEATVSHAAESLWEELAKRYKQVSDQITEIIPDISYNYSQPKNKPALPNEHELTEELIAVE